MCGRRVGTTYGSPNLLVEYRRTAHLRCRIGYWWR